MQIVFDMNYIANRTAFAISPSEIFLSTQEDRDDLRQAVLQSINFVIKKYSRVTNFVFCFDSTEKSWRYELDRGDDYKANRKTSTPRFDRQGFGKFISEFKRFLTDNGYCVLSYPHAEGDDLIYVSSNLIFKSDESVIICTADSDMKQLVKFNGTNFIAMFNMDSSKMMHYIDERTKKKEISTLDDFLSISENVTEDSNRTIIEQRSEKIIPEKALFVKVLSGDKSDNIPSVYKYLKGKSEVSFTDLRASKVFEKYYEEKVVNGGMTVEDVFEDADLPKHIIDEVQKSPDYADSEKISENININRRYVELSYKSYDNAYYDALELYVIGELTQTQNSRTFDQFIEQEDVWQ
jgi:5'-3' exonuclease, N-terminal resolvase-like domain|nr:MAG TPA: Exodeoxyribonuclease [Caudoviricetes sp.]